MRRRPGDGTRCDLLTQSHAYEIDFANNWAQAIGQSLHYAAQTKKRAGVLLILEHEGEERFHKRIQTIEHHKLPIDLMVMRPRSGSALSPNTGSTD